jgi:hypothetical protein
VTLIDSAGHGDVKLKPQVRGESETFEKARQAKEMSKIADHFDCDALPLGARVLCQRNSSSQTGS